MSFYYIIAYCKRTPLLDIEVAHCVEIEKVNIHPTIVLQHPASAHDCVPKPVTHRRLNIMSNTESRRTSFWNYFLNSRQRLCMYLTLNLYIKIWIIGALLLLKVYASTSPELCQFIMRSGDYFEGSICNTSHNSQVHIINRVIVKYYCTYLLLLFSNITLYR